MRQERKRSKSSSKKRTHRDFKVGSTIGLIGSDRIKGTVLLAAILLLLVISLTPFNVASEEEHTFKIEGRTEISKGLPEDASFSAVDVFDSNGNGRDEIYLGGASRLPRYTYGIWAYEFDLDLGEWVKFGSGLPGDDCGKSYGALDFGDLDNDGDLDIIAPLLTEWYDGDENGLEIYAGDGQGGFTFAHKISIGESSNEAIVADLDNDTYMDIVVTTLDSVKVWFGTGSLDSWQASGPPMTDNEMTGVDAGDLNNDGLLDLVACPYMGSYDIRMYIQTEARTWEEITFKEVRRQGFGIKIEDLDLDGNQDVIYGTRSQGMRAWLGNGGGSNGGMDFEWTDASAGLHDSGGHWDQMELADITGDGKPELIAANNGGSDVYVYINDLPNGWTWIFRGDDSKDEAELKADPLTVGGSAYGANFGDWDGDNDLDCVACSWGGGINAWLFDGPTSNGTSNQTSPIEYPEGGETPPELLGWDDYVFTFIFLLIGFILAICVILGTWATTLIDRLLKRGKEGSKIDPFKQIGRAYTWFIGGAVVLLVLQFLALLFSMNYDYNSMSNPFWDPPELFGVTLMGFFGFISVASAFEIGRRHIWKGVSAFIEQERPHDPSVRNSLRLLFGSYLIVYIGLCLLFICAIDFIYNQTGRTMIIFGLIMLVPFALLMNRYSLHLVLKEVNRTAERSIRVLGIDLGVAFVTLLFFPIFYLLGLDIITLMLLSPILYGIGLIVTSILTIDLMKGLDETSEVIE